MKLNFLYRYLQLSILAASAALPIANENLYAHIDQVGPPPVTVINEIVAFPPDTSELPGAIAIGHEDLFISFPFLNEVRCYSQKGEFLDLYELPVSHHNFTAGLVVKWNQEVYVIVNSYFATHPHGNGVWKITTKGEISKFADLPHGGYPSNLVFDKSDHLYVTDSVHGKIYKIDREGNVETWVHDELLKGKHSGRFFSGIPQGASGLTIGKKSKDLYVANTDYGRVLKIKINHDGSAGKIKVFADNWHLDGITALSFNRRGILYGVVPESNSIYGITKKGTKKVYAGEPLEFPTGLVMKKHKGINLGFISNSAFVCEKNPGILRIKVAVDPMHAD